MEKQKFKQTEIGEIPEDWYLKTIGDIFQFEGGSQPVKDNFIFQERGGYVRLLQIRDYKNDKYVTYIPIKSARRFCKKDDIMIGRYGPPIFQILSGLEGAYNVALIKAIPSSECNKEFVRFILKQSNIFTFVEKLSQRSSGQTGIDLFELRKYNVAFPPTKKEQTAIATVLSDTDELITSLDKLIAKKKAIKQGAMQELLTGKKRLPGFERQKGFKQTELGEIPEDWEAKPLGEIGEFKNGINKGNEDFGFGAPFVNLMDVFSRTKITNKLKLELINSNNAEKELYNLIRGDVLFIRSSVKPSGVGLTSLIVNDLKETVFSGFLIRFRSKGLLVDEYKQYCFYSGNFRTNLINNSTVSANTNINQEALKKIILAFPQSQKEQTAIATFFSDMDSELESLEKKRDKYLMIKQGMMQQLLTGKIRLI